MLIEEYLAGRHACAGRFFANQELKHMMIYLLLNYDIRLENGAVRPDNLVVGLNVLPNTEAKILLRKRTCEA
jgi:cytochrome P450